MRMSPSQDGQRMPAAARPSLPALLSTVLLLLACCVREGHGQQQQQHPARGDAGLKIPLAHGDGPRIRARSQAHLKTWAVNERLRINEKYGGIAAGSSLLEHGSTIKRRNSSAKEKKAKRQSSAASTRSSGGTITVPPSTSGASATRASTSGIAGGRDNSSSSARAPWGRTNLTNYQSDLEYYAPIRVGTPAQTFNVILDTGSSDFWLVDSNCTSVDCTQVSTFAANVSSSSASTARDFTIRYGMGSASGQLWNDTISLAGHALDDQTVALCDEVSGALLGGNASGIMGLGFPALSVTGAAPFWMNLMEDNSTDLDFDGFSFYFTRFINVTNATDTEYGGLFTLGTLSNESFTGEINYVDVPQGSESYWVVPMTAIALNGTNITDLGTPNVAIDSGTTLIGGPSQVVENFYETIGGAYALDREYEGYYTYPCDADIDISFTFGNVTYPMTSDDLNLGIFNSATNQCLGAFFDLTLSSGSAAVISWVIGGAFLKNVYSIYRYEPGPSVGFAQLSPAILANSSRRVTGSTSPRSTDGHFISGVFGGPTLPANGSIITGSPLDDSVVSATSTPAAPAPAGNQPSTISISASMGRRSMLSLSLRESGTTVFLLSIVWLGIWTLGMHS